MWVLKRAWKGHLDRVLRERFEVEVEQQSQHGSVAIRMRDGTRLGALNRDSRRVLEKMVQAGVPGADLHDGGRRGPVKLGVMDDRIYEVAAGGRGHSGWDAGVFVELFPEQAKYVGRYEKRVLTLKRAGYLTDDGRITPHFRVHYGLRRGDHAPELQRLRIDLAREAEITSEARQAPLRVPTLVEAAERDERVRRRVQRLGYSREEVERVDHQWSTRRPTRVFCRHDGSPLTLRQLLTTLRSACRRAGLRQFRWHDMRHFFGSQLAMAGVPLRQIQVWLGHSSIVTTSGTSTWHPEAAGSSSERSTPPPAVQTRCKRIERLNTK